MTEEKEKLFRDEKSLKNWVFAWAADVKGIPLDSEINDLIWVIEKHIKEHATPQPIEADPDGKTEHPCACKFIDDECADVCCYHKDLEDDYKRLQH